MHSNEGDGGLLDALRDEARQAPDSGIVDVFNYGRHHQGLIPLWVGEGDRPTPQFIADAAAASLAAGETFYTYQRGVPELRAALAGYHGRVFGGAPFTSERFFVTGGGMQAIQIATRMVSGVGDEVIVPTPAWPNLQAAVGISGASPVAVPMDFDNDRGWRLDLDRLFDAVTARTRALFINSPANPTGWTASLDELQEIAAFAEKAGIWIIADEVYHRFYYEGLRAPSFYDVADRDQPILFVNTFSKNYAMTGWRIGWLSAPPVLGQTIENLIQYSTSGVAAFMQRGATVAVEEGDAFIDDQVARAREGRRIVCEGLGRIENVRLSPPAGAFYLFFALPGEPDSVKSAYRLIDEAGVGVAPGTAFDEDTGFLRLCFARAASDLEEVVARIDRWRSRG